jgi:hypothetical protein
MILKQFEIGNFVKIKYDPTKDTPMALVGEIVELHTTGDEYNCNWCIIIPKNIKGLIKYPSELMPLFLSELEFVSIFKPNDFETVND